MASGETPENQDQSIKARKFQLFEEPAAEGVVLRPFRHYVGRTPAAPLSPVVKASLWVTGVLVALLFLAAMFAPKSKKHRAALTPPRPPAVAGPMVDGRHPTTPVV